MLRTTIETVLQNSPVDLQKLVYAGCSKISKLDLAISLSNCLGGMAAGIVGVKKVCTPKGDIEPLALIQFISAPPVRGKSAARRLFFQPHFMHDEMRLADYEQARMGDKSARLREVVITDVNNRSLLSGLEGIGHTTTIYPPEGNSLLTSYFFRQKPDVLCALWDLCEKVNLAGENGKRIVAMHINACVIVAAQPGKFEDYMDAYGLAAADIGQLQRTLPTLTPQISMPEGFRMDDADAVLKAYSDKVTAFLETNYALVRSGKVERDKLYFGSVATGEWHEMVKELSRKAAMQSNPALAQAYDRAIQHVTRIAGIIHAYFGESEEISADSLRAAWFITLWYMEQLAEIMPLKQPKPPKFTTQERQAHREFDDCRKILQVLSELEYLQNHDNPDKVGVPVSKLFTRCGIYRQRFNTAYERSKDERWIIEIGKGNDVRALLPKKLPTWAMQAPSLRSLGRSSTGFSSGAL